MLFLPDWAGADIPKYDIQYAWSANANETVRMLKIAPCMVRCKLILIALTSQFTLDIKCASKLNYFIHDANKGIK